MEAKCSSESSVGFQWAKRRYIPEDEPLYNHSFENFKSCIPYIIYLGIGFTGDLRHAQVCMHWIN
jgi:hypothetical protein